MAIRFRKTKKILPGVKLNLSKSGVSVTAGVKGASINIGKDGVYRNLGIPGTGISKRDKLKFTQDKDEDYLEVLIDYITDGEIFTLNVDATDYFSDEKAIYGYCEEVEGESIFYLNNIQRAIDVNSGNEIEDLQNFFAAAFARLCVETKKARKREGFFLAAIFGWLCVETMWRLSI